MCCRERVVVTDVPSRIKWPSFAADCVSNIAAYGADKAASDIDFNDEVGM
jgi:hypothetical protein